MESLYGLLWAFGLVWAIGAIVKVAEILFDAPVGRERRVR